MQKTWFCVQLYLGNVVLMGIFVFPDPDPDLSGGGGARGRSVVAPRPRAPHSAQTLPARPPGMLDPRRSSLHSRRQRRNSVRHGTPRRRACRRTPTVHVRVDSSS